MAGPFTREDFEKLVPVDKKLSPGWVKSLFERGTPQIFRAEALKYIGMPVGGMGAGQLYLGGDGRLWHWDIFNEVMNSGTTGPHYAEPMTPASRLEQKFTLQIGRKTYALDSDGFANVSFRGEYPIGIVEYADPVVPVTVKLEAFSPFVPLQTDDSSLPATIMQFTVHNSSALPVAAMLAGELENAVCINNRTRAGVLRNSVIREKNRTQLIFSAENPTDNPAVTESAPGKGNPPLKELRDFGTMALALLGKAADQASPDATAPFAQKLTGSLGRKLKLAPGGSTTVTFVIAWHFPNLSLGGTDWNPATDSHVGPLVINAGRYYATRFSSAHAVVQYIADNFDRLATQTRLWRDTWYDSTLPFWFLDRTMLNTSILATSTCYRFANGRFYGWEGVGCCPGTCGHVYHYAHAAARLFPELERDTRERVDFGLALQRDGAIHFRAEFNNSPAVDGQAGTILRALREHQMSADAEFLKRNWPKIRLATQWLIAKDADNDGLIESSQPNTLDADWFGKVSWLSGLYLAALQGAAAMADEVGDAEFARQCRGILEVGRKNLVEQLFDGEYFINKVDPKKLRTINSGTGCEIDQVFGQSWAMQVGLPRVLPQKETLSALKSLWKYNFSPDAGDYHNKMGSGRWYAMPGEAGLLMCTFPRKDWDFLKACGVGNKKRTLGGYFNECMNGFEYQVAGHMIWEGMVMEGLAVARAVHDRYDASKRNPWNEVECGDHYARSMASYGVYLAACGFDYNGPQQHIGFAPKLTPENFKCAFTAAEGWGSFEQRIQTSEFKSQISMKHGRLKVKTIALGVAGVKFGSVQVAVSGKSVESRLGFTGDRALITLMNDSVIKAGESIKIILR
jgi:uncharacterized protein (DUF608 family)